MFKKVHQPPDYTAYLLAAENRIPLNTVDQMTLTNYLKGCAGEEQYYQHALQFHGLHFWNIALKNPGHAQYDFLHIHQQKLFHIDIKNYSGEVLMNGSQLITKSDYHYQDILTQLDRADYYLKKFVKQQGFNIEVISRILFINPDFLLKNYNNDPRILLPAQLPQLINYFTKETVISSEEFQLANKLIQHHQTVNPHERIVYYPFNDMRKGIRCPKCRQIGMKAPSKKQTIVCRCGYRCSKSDILKLSIDEMLMLKNAPLRRIEIEQWTGMNWRSILRVLNQHYEMHYQNKSTVYTHRKKK